MISPNLGIAHLVQPISQPEVAINALLDALDNASNGTLSWNVTGNITATQAQMASAFTHILAGSVASGFTFNLPAFKRVFAVHNKTSQVCTVQVSGGGGASITVTGGNKSLLYCDGVDVQTITFSGSASQGLDSIGSTRGSILYRGASSWQALSPGAKNSALMSNGAGADPSWNNIATYRDPMLPVFLATPTLNTSAHATKGCLFTVMQDFDIRYVTAVMDPNGSHQVKAMLFTHSGGLLGYEIAQSSVLTPASANGTTIQFDLGQEYTLSAGQTYFLCIVLTSGVGTTSCPLQDTNTSTVVAQAPCYFNPISIFGIASVAPVAGNSLTDLGDHPLIGF